MKVMFNMDATVLGQRAYKQLQQEVGGEKMKFWLKDKGFNLDSMFARMNTIYHIDELPLISEE